MLFKAKSANEILTQWEKQKPIIEAQEQVRVEKEAILGKKIKLSMTKRLMLFIIANCTVIEIFTGHLMCEQLRIASIQGTTIDTQPQITLISAVVGEVIAFLIYAFKSLQENKVGGITYDTAMRQLEIDNTNNDCNDNSKG